MIRCTVGVMAYNEERNIGSVLRALLNQQLASCQIAEIVVVASGCTDRTVERAQEIAREHPLIRVEEQGERAGKAAAINHLIRVAQGEVIVLVGADTLPDPTALEHLARPFADAQVGMTGARVVPLNDPRAFPGFAVQVLWYLHHRMALRWPKLGELVAFRNVVAALPTDSATDEVSLEALLSAQGYRLVYVPDALVYNYGPRTVDDFLLQRRRIFAGHLGVAAQQGYAAASMSGKHLLLLALEAFWSYRCSLVWLLGVIVLELMGRALGMLDFVLGTQHHIWRPVRSTKQLSAQAQQPLTLLALRCVDGKLSPTCLRRSSQQPAAATHRLLWWDDKRGQVIYRLAPEQSANDALEACVSTLGARLTPVPQASHYPVFEYRVMQFV
jgi:cellulose synthase/poly-beta-1,6-N-acetylglucosamine synthase-like glycosyltransferase